MIRAFHLSAATLAAVLVCSGAGAQMRGRAVSVRMPTQRLAPIARASFSTAASGAMLRINRPATVIRISPTGQVISSTSGFANSSSFSSSNGVPGLGFDYTHLAAIGGGFNNSTNFGRGPHRRQASIAPILIGGYPYYPGDYYADPSDYAQPQEQPPQVIVVQQQAPARQQDVGSGSESAIPSTVSSALAPAAPLPDVGDFILVRRDGRILFASAFSITGDQLRYVTPEGIRRSLPMSELDADATQQMNEARGTTVQLHN